MVQILEKNKLHFEFKVRIIIKPKHKPSVFKLFHNNGLKMHIKYASAPTFIHQLQFCPQSSLPFKGKRNVIHDIFNEFNEFPCN